MVTLVDAKEGALKLLNDFGVTPAASSDGRPCLRTRAGMELEAKPKLGQSLTKSAPVNASRYLPELSSIIARCSLTSANVSRSQ